MIIELTRDELEMITDWYRMVDDEYGASKEETELYNKIKELLDS